MSLPPHITLTLQHASSYMLAITHQQKMKKKLSVYDLIDRRAPTGENVQLRDSQETNIVCISVSFISSLAQSVR